MNVKCIFERLRRKRQRWQYAEPTFPGLEMECKINGRLLADSDIYRALKQLELNGAELLGLEYRTEFHHFYKRRAHGRAFVFCQGSAEVWFKEKGPKKVVRSKGLQIPILVRSERKLRPDDKTYAKSFEETLHWSFGGSFKKELVDAVLLWRETIFSITIAKAFAERSVLTQVEIEYEGHSQLAKRPSKKAVIAKHLGQCGIERDARIGSSQSTSHHLRAKSSLQRSPVASIGWHTFRHTFRTLLDETGAPMKVQQELMRHADIRTTMNVYGKAMDESKRAAHGKVVRLVLPSKVA